MSKPTNQIDYYDACKKCGALLHEREFEPYLSLSYCPNRECELEGVYVQPVAHKVGIGKYGIVERGVAKVGDSWATAFRLRSMICAGSRSGTTDEQAEHAKVARDRAGDPDVLAQETSNRKR
jgi:hypothetical protein